jgi:hypothetical protein
MALTALTEPHTLGRTITRFPSPRQWVVLHTLAQCILVTGSLQATNLGAPATCQGAPQITVEQSGKNKIFFGYAAGVPGNHSYY